MKGIIGDGGGGGRSESGRRGTTPPKVGNRLDLLISQVLLTVVNSFSRLVSRVSFLFTTSRPALVAFLVLTRRRREWGNYNILEKEKKYKIKYKYK